MSDYADSTADSLKAAKLINYNRRVRVLIITLIEKHSSVPVISKKHGINKVI